MERIADGRPEPLGLDSAVAAPWRSGYRRSSPFLITLLAERRRPLASIAG
jgi:hypothetical protein